MPEAYKCRGCGIVKPDKWSFRCPGCGGFFNYIRVNSDMKGAKQAPLIEGEFISLQDAINQAEEIERIKTGIEGVDHVLCGGFARGSLTLLCGDAGVGKSTLVIQIFQAVARKKYDSIIFTGEQTVKDIALRAQSFGKFAANMVAIRMYDLDEIIDSIVDRRPDIIAIDSVQTLMVDEDLEMGSAMSIKIAVRQLADIAKDENVAMVLIGHISKNGGIAGPKTLEHYVDTNLYFAGNALNSDRLLRCDFKNRYGSAPRKAKFKMTEKGLRDMTNVVEISPKNEQPEK